MLLLKYCYARPPAPEGAIMFEDDGKETSSDEMNTSHEDLTCTVWSEEEDNANTEAAEVTVTLSEEELLDVYAVLFNHVNIYRV